MNDVPMAGQEGPNASLAELLQQSRKLTNQLGRSDLPQIQLGLDQIENQSRKLVSKGLRSGQAGDAKAHYFLANGGIDAAELSETINSVNIPNTFEPLQPIYDTDVDSYLRHEHEQVILSAIEEGRRETLKDFHSNLSRTMHRDWERQKRKIFEELGQHQPGKGDWSTADFGASRGFAPSTSAADLSRSTPMAGGNMMQMHSRMMRYDTVVKRLNEYRLEGYSFGLVHAFLDAVKGMGQDPKVQQLAESWQVLTHLVREKDVINGEFQRAAIRERQYAQTYVDPATYQSADGVTLRNNLIEGAKAFLEAQFSEYVETTIASNPVKASLGGAPSVQNRIAAFLRVYHQNREGQWAVPELEVINNTPIWAHIFYLLRTGHASEALDFAAEHENLLLRLDRSFLAYFKAWLDSPERRLPKLLRDRFFAEYNSRFRNVADGNDPYKQALYKLIGRIDVTKKFPALVTKSTENWLWLQLCLVRESYDEGADGQDSVRDRYTLADLGRKLVNYGEAHFDPKGNRPLHYFQILLLSGQFERAVAFLYSRSQHQVDAVQFAVALAYYGLLRVPSAANTSQVDYLTLDVDASGTEVAYVDFAKLVQRYTRLFAQADAREALQYLYLICLNADAPQPAGSEQVHKCHDLIRSLVLETRQYFELLGDIRNDGTKTPGLIEKNLRLIRLSDEREYLSSIVRAAAAQSDAEHRTRDAILLYNLAEDYDTVVAVLNKELGAGLTEPTGRPAGSTEGLNPSASFAASEDTATMARAILESYERQNHIIRRVSLKNRETCRVLLQLKESVALFTAGEIEKALQAIESLDLVPLDGDVVSITRKAEDFKEVDDNIARNFSEILLMTMNILFKVHQGLKESPYGDASRQNKMIAIRKKARALMMWAGMLRFRMSSETYSQLTRLDVFIH